jgi:hypothetical protein
MNFFWALVWGGIFGFSEVSLAFSEEADVIPPIMLEKKILGRSTSVESRAMAISENSGVSSSLAATLIGRPAALVEFQAQVSPMVSTLTGPLSTGTELARTSLYVHGIKIGGGVLRFAQGALQYSGGVPPTQIPFPIVTYPLGPVLLKVDAGIEFEGKFEAALTPGISIPISDSSVQAKLSGDLAASGFIEGYGSVFVARAGIEGRVSLIEGESGVETLLSFNHLKPESRAFGRVRFLRGTIEGFLDIRMALLHWRRVLSKKFFSWPGNCFAFGSASCD